MSKLYAQKNAVQQPSRTTSGNTAKVDYARLGLTSSQGAAIERYRNRIGTYDWKRSYAYDPFDEEDSVREARGIIPKSLQKTYKRTAVDNALFMLGLPAQSKIESVAKKAESERETQRKNEIAAAKKKAQAQEKARLNAIADSYDLEDYVSGMGTDGVFERDENGFLPAAQTQQIVGNAAQTQQTNNAAAPQAASSPTPTKTADIPAQDITWKGGVGTDASGRKYTKNPLTGAISEVTSEKARENLEIKPIEKKQPVRDEARKITWIDDDWGMGDDGVYYVKDKHGIIKPQYQVVSTPQSQQEAAAEPKAYTSSAAADTSSEIPLPDNSGRYLVNGQYMTADEIRAAANDPATAFLRTGIKKSGSLPGVPEGTMEYTMSELSNRLDRRAEAERKTAAEARAEALAQKYYRETIPAASDYDAAAAKGAEMQLPLEQRTGKLSSLDLSTNPYENQTRTAQGEGALINYMTPDERKVYDYLRGKGDESGAQRYWESIKEDLETRFTQRSIYQHERFGEEEGALSAVLLSTIDTIPSTIRGAAYIADRAINRKEINPFNSAFEGQLGASAALGKATENWSDFGKKAINLAVSIGQNALRYGLFGAAGKGVSLGFMATGVFQDSMRDAKLRGATDEQAVGISLIKSIMEVATENAGFDRYSEALFGNATAQKAWIGAVLSAAKSMLPEAMEEGASEIAGIIGDALVLGSKGEVQQAAAEYRATHPDATREEVARYMSGVLMGQVTEAALGGAISGGVMSGGAALIGGLTNQTRSQMTEAAPMDNYQQENYVYENNFSPVEASDVATETEIAQMFALEERLSEVNAQLELDPTNLQLEAERAQIMDALNRADGTLAQDVAQQDAEGVALDTQLDQQSSAINAPYEELLSELAQTRFSSYGVSDTVRQTMGNAVNLTGSTDVSTKYAELSQRFPSLFPAEISGVENQLGQISRVIRSLRSGQYQASAADIRGFQQEAQAQMADVETREAARRQMQSLSDRLANIQDKTSKQALKLRAQIEQLAEIAGTETQTQNQSELSRLQADNAQYDEFLRSYLPQYNAESVSMDATPDQLNALNERLSEIDAALDAGTDDLRLEMDRALIVEMLNGERPVDMQLVPDYTEAEDFITTGGNAVSNETRGMLPALSESSDASAATENSETSSELLPSPEPSEPARPQRRQRRKNAGQTEDVYQRTTLPKANEVTPQQVKHITEFAEAAEQYGAIKPGMEPAARHDAVPKSVDGDTKVSKAIRTLYESPATPDEAISVLEEATLSGLGSYTPKSFYQLENDAVERRRSETTNVAQAADNIIAEIEGTLGDRANRTLAAQAEDVAYLAQLYMEAQAAGDFDTARKIAAIDAAIQTNSGQINSAHKLFKLMTSEGRFSVYERMAAATAREYAWKRGGKDGLEKFKIEIPAELKETYIKADFAATRDASDANVLALADAEHAVMRYIAEQIPPTWRAYLDSLRHLNMLGNLKTNIRNTVGNVGMYGQRNLRDVISGLYQDLFINDPTQQTATLFRSELTSEQKHAAKAWAKSDAEAQLDVLQNGGTGNSVGFRMDELRSLQREVAKENNIFANVLFTLSDASGAALEKGDAVFLKANYREALYNYMKAQNLTVDQMKGRTLYAARSAATVEALKATYRDNSEFANKLRSMANTNGLANLLIEGLMPYKKTPINVAKRGLEYSPLGLANGVRMALFAKSNGYTGAQICNAFAEGTVGTILAGTGFLLAQLGILHATGDDPDKAQYEKTLGKQQYSLDVLGGNITIDWISPTAIPLFVGARLSEMLKNVDDTAAADGETRFSDKVGMALESLLGIASPVFEMSCMSGFNDAMDALQNQQIGDNASVTLIANLTLSYLSQITNNSLLKQIAKVVDPVRRDSYYSSSTTVGGRLLDRFVNRTASSFPFLSQTLPAYIGNDGEEQRYWEEGDAEGAIRNAIEQTVLPWYNGKGEATDVDTERLRLYDTTKVDVLPRYVGASVTYNGTDYKQDANERVNYKKSYGRVQTEYGEKLIESKGYQLAGDEMKAELMRKLASFSQTQADIRFLRARGIEVDSGKTAFKNAAKVEIAEQRGISPGDFWAVQYVNGQLTGEIKDPISGKTISGGKKRRLESYMKQLGLTQDQIEFLQEVIG